MLTSFVSLFPISVAQGLIYGLIALGIMIPFRLLNLPDLSCEGTFPLGGCVCAACISAGMSPILATLLGVLAGMLGGMATALLHLKLRIHSLLAGILVLTMLWSVNLRIMGRSNLSIFGDPTVFDLINPRIAESAALQIIFFGALTLLLIGLLFWFMGTELGLGLRGVGTNITFAAALGLNVSSYTIAGLAGALVAQIQGYADVSMGFGVLINGLAGVIIGEAILGRARLLRQIAAPCFGALIYYQLVSLALSSGLQPSDLRLATGLFVVATLAVPMLLGRRRAAGDAI
jgi:putative ABC transport system permease protein